LTNRRQTIFGKAVWLFFAKLKEVQADTQSQRFCTTFNFAQPHPSPPTTLQVEMGLFNQQQDDTLKFNHNLVGCNDNKQN